METQTHSPLAIRMLGPFEARCMGTPIPRHAWGRSKSLAIAKFLIAHRGGFVSLGTISELFYEGAPVERIRSNVRGRISEIRRALWPDRNHPDYESGIQFVSGSGFRFDPQEPCWIDVEWFHRHLEAANEHYRQEMWQLALDEFARAHALYRGDFLADDLDDRWTFDVREGLRLAYQSSLTQAAECHLRLGQYRQAVAVARRARDLDPLDEEAYRMEIEAYGHIPDKDAALGVYRELVQALRELSVEPDPEIVELVRRIKKGSLKPSTPKPRHNLVQQLTPFFGREQELDTLRQRLADPQTRVITLLGPGGIGKTRLALEAARQLTTAFRDGVFYVPVSEYEGAQGLAVGIAQTIGFSVNRPNSGVSELADFLSNKAMLLIIDAAEHARDAAPLFDTLIRAPGVKLLITSRVRLHLPGEFIIDVEGLPYGAPSGDPTPEKSISIESTPAYRLFVDRYARLRPRFRPTAEDSRAIALICRMVEGMPLALEMAASWGRVLTCVEIAERVASPDTLTGSPDGQIQAMESVFAFSWKMLTEAEQRAAMRLSTFAGSFSRPAAECVADCPASTIMSLGDKSFVQWDPQGRFRIHEVIRAFLRRQLAMDPDIEVQAYQAHAMYFASLLDCDPIRALGQGRIDELKYDLLNVQQAWRWWTSHLEIRTLHRTLRPVAQLHESSDQWATLLQLLETTIDRIRNEIPSLQAQDDENAATGLRDAHVARAAGMDPQYEQLILLWAALLTQLANVSMRVGDLVRAESALNNAQKALDALRRDAAAAPAGVSGEGTAAGPALDDTGEGARTTVVEAHLRAVNKMLNGWFSLDRSDVAKAKSLLLAAVQELQALGDEWNQSGAMSLLATVARTTGDLERSRQLYEECLAIHQRLGDPRSIAGDLLNLGSLYGNLQQYDEAERYFHEARRYAAEGNHRLLLFFIIGNSGFLAYRRSRLTEAEALCLEAMDLAVDIGHKGGQAIVAYYLALIALDRRQPERALPYLVKALEQSLASQALQVTFQALHGYARYFALVGENEEAAALLRFVLNQPGYPQAARKRSEEVLASLVPQLSATQIQSAEKKAATQSLDDFVARLRSVTGAL